MSPARTMPFVLLALLGSLGAGAWADEGVVVATQVTEAPAAEERLAIPFEHRVGERWRIVVERREGPAEHEGTATETEVEAEVLSPYGRDLLVEVRALAWTEGGRRLALVPRSAANAARLDERGGGRLALRVNHEGTAVDLLNGEEAHAALSRARGRVAEAAWPAEKQALLEEWNTVYRSCGVPLVPGRTQTTPLLDEVRREVGRDVRVLGVEPRGQGRVPALSLSASTAFAAHDGLGASWRETFSARFDLDLRRLSGSSVVERGEAGRMRRVCLTFREAAAPPAPPVLAAR